MNNFISNSSSHIMYIAHPNLILMQKFNFLFRINKYLQTNRVQSENEIKRN